MRVPGQGKSAKTTQPGSEGKSRRPVRWRLTAIASLSFVLGLGLATTLVIVQQYLREKLDRTGSPHSFLADAEQTPPQPIGANGRPQIFPLPAAQDVWTCDVVVVGGSLGGVAAASHAMKSGAVTCLIELSPWLGGQLSSQGVSAIDESKAMWTDYSFSDSWINFKQRIKQQPVKLPSWSTAPTGQQVSAFNSCWVGRLCFPPQAGAMAALQLLKSSVEQAPGSRWGTAIAFKGAEFDSSGRNITAIYAVRRIPHNSAYAPLGKLSQELSSWYSWQSDPEFEKVPIRLQAHPGKRMMVIDATDTGELVAWAGIPYRLGADSRALTDERHASKVTNPDCTQAFTFPFVLAIHDDGGASLSQLEQVKPLYSREEHEREYSVKGFSMFEGKGFFNYRRIISTTLNDPFHSPTAPGDMTLVNWNNGNDWGIMNPPLILNDRQLESSGQRQNWMGGLSTIALRHAEDHALLFAQWLLENQSQPGFPLTYLSGTEAPMGTLSGLSMMPYLREGRRILGRSAHGQPEFFLREADLRRDMTNGRDFGETSIAVTHYAIDMHGCRYRNWGPSWEANSAPVKATTVRPLQVPLEAIIPQGVDNLLIGGKSLAVSHIANAVTRVHYSEWNIGAASGSTAAWLIKQAPPNITAAEIVSRQLMPRLQRYLVSQGLRLDW